MQRRLGGLPAQQIVDPRVDFGMRIGLMETHLRASVE